MSFIKIVVEEVIGDTSIYTPEKMREIVPKILNKRQFCDEPPQEDQEEEIPYEDRKYFLRAPRNSVLATIKSEGKNVDREENDAKIETEQDASLHVFYPFFSSHITMPVKPGETVWGIELDGASYWMSRVHGPLHVEDANQTHLDRSNMPVRQPPIITPEELEETQKASDDNIISRVPNFQDGDSFLTRNTDKKEKTDEEIVAGNDKRTFQYEPSSTGNSRYEFINENAEESTRHVQEPVPAFTCRPGDLAFQGSNNTLISLGIDRGYSKSSNRPDATKTNAQSPEDGLPERAGAIDIVSGRGRFFEDEINDDIQDSDPLEQTTRPRIVKNSREKFESDKNTGLDEGLAPDGGNLLDAPEGDPDFLHDASRVYVSMKSSADELLGLSYPKIPLVDDSENVGTDIPLIENAATVAIKSDEIRIVARQEPEGGPTEEIKINGSVKIVKEGIEDDETGLGRAVIIMQPDGTIMIDGPKIVLGSGIEKAHGEGNQLSLGLDATEPIVLGHELVGILSAIIDVLDKHVHPSAAGPTGPRAGGAELTPLGGFSNTSDPLADLQCILSKIGKTK